MTEESRENYDSYVNKSDEIRSEQSLTELLHEISDNNFREAELSARDQYNELKQGFLDEENARNRSFSGKTKRYLKGAASDLLEYPGSPQSAAKGLTIEVGQQLPRILQSLRFAKNASGKTKLVKETVEASVDRIVMKEKQAFSGFVDTATGKVSKANPLKGHAEIATDLGIDIVDGKLPNNVEGFLVQKLDGTVQSIGSQYNKTANELSSVAQEMVSEFFK